MRIAIATDAGMVSRHFGHCEGFTVYDVENDKIAKEEFLANPGHKKGFLNFVLPCFHDKDSVGSEKQILFRQRAGCGHSFVVAVVYVWYSTTFFSPSSQ